MKVSVTRVINSAHRLVGTNIHGHTYRITAIVDSRKDAVSGIAISFATLQKFLDAAVGHYDHDQLERTLSDLPATAENLATCTARSMSKAMNMLVNIRVAVGEDGIVETDMYQRQDGSGEYFSL